MRSLRMAVGKFVMRCGLFIAFGRRELYREVTLTIEDLTTRDETS